MALPKLASKKVHFPEGLHENGRDGRREHPCLFLKFEIPATLFRPNPRPLDLGFEEHLNLILRKESSREDCKKVISTWKEGEGERMDAQAK